MRVISLTTSSILGLMLSSLTVANTNGQVVSTGACRALADLRIEDTNMLSAKIVPAGNDLPEFCRVLGYVRPAINFEIRLPTANWNGNFYMAGCGGFCGKLESGNDRINAINIGLKRNYAVATTDGGHWGETIFDGRWAHDNRLAEIDFGYRAVHETVRITKTVIKAFYRQAPGRSYFQGCSGAGRQANMAAWRYPDDFDGIISGAPDSDRTKLSILQTWLVQANTGLDGMDLITPVDAELVRKAAYQQCDSLDGLQDGLISDPRTCTFDPASLACGSDDETSCLSAEQVKALHAFYDGPRNAAGERLYPEGVPLGSEPYWGLWITGETDDPSDGIAAAISREYLRYMGFEDDPGDAYAVANFDFENDPLRLEYMESYYDSDDPDLEAFRRGSGKLLMWHGWADPIIPPLKTIAYYEAVEDLVGSRDSTQAFLRLFMVPGMDHCGLMEGPGVTDSGFDLLTALERWVEEGEAPASLLATKRDSTGNVLWTRPLCPYPERAVYKGHGDVKEASSFECITP